MFLNNGLIWCFLSLSCGGGGDVGRVRLVFMGTALLSGTLRTYQRAGCDDEVVTLRCPPGTSISIELAQYGKSAPSKSLCGPKATQSSISKTSYNYNVSCLWPNSLQVSVKSSVFLNGT